MMKPWQLPSGRQRGIPFILADDWTPEQALAVVELLDDLRERICAHYQIPLHNLLREQRSAAPDPQRPCPDVGDPPF
jgi:hypothetical protein